MIRGLLFAGAGVALTVVLVVSTTHREDVGPQATAGLPWRSGASSSNWQHFQQWIGRPIDVWVVWNNEATWERMEALYALEGTDRPIRFPGVLSIGLPLLAVGDNYQQCASGALDHHYYVIATKLRAAGRENSYVRFSYEMNGEWFRWRATEDPEGFVQCFARASKVFKSVAREFRIEWNPSAGSLPSDASKMYPGDDVVDVVAVDNYDGYPAVVDDKAWNVKCGGDRVMDPEGVCDYVQFARAHGKKMSFPEWGIRADGEGGSFDNPYFICRMARFFVDHSQEIEYESIFDTESSKFQLSNGANPRAAESYRLWFHGSHEHFDGVASGSCF